MADLTCPFCGQHADSEYKILFHLEAEHSEGQSPFLADRYESEAGGSAANELPSLIAEQAAMDYVGCPIAGCGEAIMVTELDSHIDMHECEVHASDSDTDDLSDSESQSETTTESNVKAIKQSLAKSSSRSYGEADGASSHTMERQENAKAVWKKLLNMPSTTKPKPAVSEQQGRKPPQRLGKAELGPHANESEMPGWLKKKLLEDDGALKKVKRPDRDGKLRTVEFSPNQTAGIIPVISQLIQQDRNVNHAFLCHPEVLHVSKLWREGGFCGYRNIQMMSSYIIAVKSQGYPHFDGKVPSIFKIQEYIESGWNMGFNSQGRIETGGIKGTRKYIGTPEAQAMFLGLDIACTAQGFRTKGEDRAEKNLYQYVENYFKHDIPSTSNKVRLTAKPPLYFQHPGHSMTIIGFERSKDDKPGLLVFDPMFGDSSRVRKLIGQTFKEHDPAELLKPYRRAGKYLGKYKDFEVLGLSPPKPQVGWAAD